MNGQRAPMPEAPVTAEIHQSFDVHGYFCAKFPFDLIFVIDDLTNAVDFSFGEIVCVGIWIDVKLIQDPVGRGSSDTVNIGQTNFNPFASG
jgi:hypothetical protein